jgi:hypothetical protein
MNDKITRSYQDGQHRTLRRAIHSFILGLFMVSFIYHHPHRFRTVRYQLSHCFLHPPPHLSFIHPFIHLHLHRPPHARSIHQDIPSRITYKTRTVSCTFLSLFWNPHIHNTHRLSYIHFIHTALVDSFSHCFPDLFFYPLLVDIICAPHLISISYSTVL